MAVFACLGGRESVADHYNLIYECIILIQIIYCSTGGYELSQSDQFFTGVQYKYDRSKKNTVNNSSLAASKVKVSTIEDY